MRRRVEARVPELIFPIESNFLGINLCEKASGVDGPRAVPRTQIEGNFR